MSVARWDGWSFRCWVVSCGSYIHSFFQGSQANKYSFFCCTDTGSYLLYLIVSEFFALSSICNACILLVCFSIVGVLMSFPSLLACLPACLFIAAREWSVLFGEREMVVCVSFRGKGRGVGGGAGLEMG